MFVPLHRRIAIALVAVAAGISFGAAGARAQSGYSSIETTAIATRDPMTGAYANGAMSVQVVLAPRNEAQLETMLAAVSTPASSSYGHYLTKGRFASLFGPSAAAVSSVTAYLQSAGLSVAPSAFSPFVLVARGSSASIAAAFRTSLHTYRNSRGIEYFANASAAQLPSSIAPAVRGIVGLTSTVLARPHYRVANRAAKPVSCDAPYPKRAQLYAAVNDGTPFASGYGNGPGCNGLSPSQVRGIYNAPSFGNRSQGAGVNIAVYELSAYLPSDIATWTATFYGPGYQAPLVDVLTDGGPRHPKCPAVDACPPDANYYSGDIEVDADIEEQLTIAPAVSHVLVYEAPDDTTGQTELDNFYRIADDDVADVVSTSWGVCENDITPAYAQAENLVFEQMALQGQSLFSATGDTGAFGCIDNDGTTVLNVGDPAEPFVTDVGGTSFESFDPGTNPAPAYPAGNETVWNTDDLCNQKASEGGIPGLEWCSLTGAGNGGLSEYWSLPFYQVFGRLSGNMRHVPDVSANADPYTPYAEYCTGSARTPYSTCATFSGTDTPPGWLGIGGTSLAAPLWSGIFADRDGFFGTRSGLVNPLLYALYDAAPNVYFHDITGIGQTTVDNGYYPTTPGYDLATGIGTPNISALVTGF